MALKLHFASLSVGASVDQQTGNLSVFDVIQEIRAPQVPLQLQSLVISLILEKTDPGSAGGKLFIHLIAPDGSQAMVGAGDMQVPSEQHRMKAVFRFGGFPLTQFGAHRFVVSWVNISNLKEGEAILDFEVMQAPAPNSPEGPGTPQQKPPLSH